MIANLHPYLQALGIVLLLLVFAGLVAFIVAYVVWPAITNGTDRTNGTDEETLKEIEKWRDGE